MTTFAKVTTPSFLALDSQSVLYVVSKSTVYKVDASGVPKLFLAGRYNYGIAVDTKDRFAVGYRHGGSTCKPETLCHTLKVGTSSKNIGGYCASARTCCINCKIPYYVGRLANLGEEIYGARNLNRVYQLAEKGVLKEVLVAGTGGNGPAGDKGAATAATFSSIAAIGFDRQGNMYIADSGRGNVRWIKAPFK